MEMVRWGIIGCGNVTEVKSGPGFQKADGSQLVAVMRRTGRLAKDYAERHNVPRWYDDAESLVHDPEVDAVYVATPPASHKEHALLAVEAGKPVYVEKPMAMNHAQCEAMLEASRSAGVPLFVAYYRRGLKRFLKIKELIEARAIGEVRFVNVTLYQGVRPEELDPAHLPWRVVPDVAGGGRFVDLASHMLDFMDFVLGPIAAAEGFARNQAGHYPAEDVVAAALEFESGVLAAGTWCFTAFEEVDRTELVGNRGRISYSTFGEDPVVLTTRDGVKAFRVPYPSHAQQPLIQTVVDELRGWGKCPSTGESGARTNWVMDKIMNGYRTQLGVQEQL